MICQLPRGCDTHRVGFLRGLPTSHDSVSLEEVVFIGPLVQLRPVLAQDNIDVVLNHAGVRRDLPDIRTTLGCR